MERLRKKTFRSYPGVFLIYTIFQELFPGVKCISRSFQKFTGVVVSMYLQQNIFNSVSTRHFLIFKLCFGHVMVIKIYGWPQKRIFYYWCKFQGCSISTTETFWAPLCPPPKVGQMGDIDKKIHFRWEINGFICKIT